MSPQSLSHDGSLKLCWKVIWAHGSLCFRVIPQGSPERQGWGHGAEACLEACRASREMLCLCLEVWGGSPGPGRQKASDPGPHQSLGAWSGRRPPWRWAQGLTAKGPGDSGVMEMHCYLPWMPRYTHLSKFIKLYVSHFNVCTLHLN